TPAAQPKRRRIGLTGWIFICMGLGMLLGWLTPEFAAGLKPFSNLFLRAIKMIVVPILFGTLVVGIAGHGDDPKRIGRQAGKSLIYFTIMTSVALVIGLTAGNITRPGDGVILPPEDLTAGIPEAAPTTLDGFLSHIVPTSFFQAAATNTVLQVVFFAVMFAIALSQVPAGKPKETVLHFFEGFTEAIFKLVHMIMLYAPIGIGAAMAVTVSHSGIGVIINLGKLVGTLYLSLVVFGLVALIPSMMIAKVPIKKFFRYVKEPAIIAFTTTSSDAALPV